MWIMTGQMFKKLFVMISGNLSNIQKQLIFDRQIKVHTARRLIDFKNTIEFFNGLLHSRIKDLHESSDRKISVYNDITSIEIRLITYISTWSINVKQGIIRPKIIKRCLGSLLYEENRLLKNSLNYLYFHNNLKYIDAVNCEWLFNKCAKVRNEEGNKNVF